MKCHNNNGILTFLGMEDKTKYIKLNEICDIYVGLVSGLDKVFKNEKYGNIHIKTDIDKSCKFIFLNELPNVENDVTIYLESNKEILSNRRICKITENNWYKFGAIRNKKIMESENKKCIYMKTITRNNIISCVDKLQYFSGSLLTIVPKTNEDVLQKLCNFLNSDIFKQRYMSDNRFIISHNQLSNALIPSNLFS
jgi:adenine-specific DNA-methyltransferase